MGFVDFLSGRHRAVWAIAWMALCVACASPAWASPPVTQIQAGYDPTRCLDIFGGSRKTKYGVDLFRCGVNDPHESFAFKPMANGYYAIVPQNGGDLCLDANGIAAADTVQAVQNTCSGRTSQLWTLRENADHTYSILTADGTHGLRVEGERPTANRTRILVQAATNAPEQRFYLPCYARGGEPPRPGAATDGERTIGPCYIADPALKPRPDVPKGTIISFTMNSAESRYFPGASLGAFSRKVWVYVPRQYVKGQKAPFMVTQDAALRPMLANFLDNAIHDRKLPVMVVVFAGNGGGGGGIRDARLPPGRGSERSVEYDTLSARYGQWVQDELLPRAAAETRAQIPDQAVTFTSDPEGRGAAGCSSGGAAAFTMAWFQPNLFRRVISYSGSFTNLQYPPDPNYPHGAASYADLIRSSPAKPIRIWMEVGTKDLDWSKWGPFLEWHAANRAMAAALASKGYHYHFDVAVGARHCDGRVPAETLPEAMLWLWKDYPIR